MSAPRKINAQITRIQEISEKIKVFTLKPTKDIRSKYKSGQFLQLAIDEYDPSFPWPESRAFSIATPPSKAYEIRLIVSKKGVFTSRMFDELYEGKSVWIKLPYGDFNYNFTKSKSIIMIAGGTGISPFIPFLEQEIISQSIRFIRLYYGVRNLNSIIIEDLLDKCNQELKNFEYNLYSETPGSNTELKHSIGVLPLEDIIKLDQSSINAQYLISGPEGLIRDTIEIANNIGINKERIHFDKWE